MSDLASNSFILGSPLREIFWPCEMLFCRPGSVLLFEGEFSVLGPFIYCHSSFSLTRVIWLRSFSYLTICSCCFSSRICFVCSRRCNSYWFSSSIFCCILRRSGECNRFPSAFSHQIEVSA